MKGESLKSPEQFAYNDKSGASYQISTINVGPGKSQWIIYKTISGTKTKQWASDIVVSGIPPGIFFDFDKIQHVYLILKPRSKKITCLRPGTK